MLKTIFADFKAVNEHTTVDPRCQDVIPLSPVRRLKNL